jgi:hypothetical protein
MSEPSKLPSKKEIEERLARLKNPPQLEYRRPSPLTFKEYTINEQGKRVYSSEESTSPTPTPSPPSRSPSPVVSPNPSPPLSPPPEEVKEERMASIRELSTATVPGGPPTGIVYPAPAAGNHAEFELKSGFLHQLPRFHGLNMEDANKHLRAFQAVCENMQPQGADETIFKMKAFSFSLADRAKDWLYEIPAGRITSWDTMKKAFLEKYFPASKVITLRKKLSGIEQAHDESYGAYYERFNSLLAQCPQHQMKDETLLTCFYEGLLPLERQMLDAAAGGAFVDKSPAAGRELIENRALNTQQYEGVRQTTRRVNEVSTSPAIADQLNKLTLLVNKVATTQVQGGSSACGVCFTQGHPTDQCPQLSENGGWESVNAIGGYQGNQGGPSRPRYDPYSNTYNPGWRDHPNFKWTNNENVQNPLGGSFQRSQGPSSQGPSFQRPYMPPQQNVGNSNSHYDKTIEALTNSTQALTSATQTLLQGQQNHTKDIADHNFLSFKVSTSTCALRGF